MERSLRVSAMAKGESLLRQPALAGDENLRMNNEAICIREGKKAGTPIFFMHDGELFGELAYVYDMTKHLSPEFTVYGLAGQHEADTPLLETVEAMASRLKQMIIAVQPEGPYRLAGWSYGGLLAYEVAYQLLGADYAIEFLGLINTEYYLGLKNAPSDNSLSELKQYLIFEAEKLAHGSQESSLSLSKIQTLAVSADFAAVLDGCRIISLLPRRFANLSDDAVERALTRERVYRIAASQYVAPSLNIPLYLFTIGRSDHNPFSGWDEVLETEQIQLVPVAGVHESAMQKPDAATLAAVVSAMLFDANQRSAILSKTSQTALIPLQEQKNINSLILCIPGAGDEVTSFLDIILQLDSECPVYGIQHRGIDGQSTPHSSVEAAAAYYLPSIVDLTRSRDLRLVGHSFGGWIAFELALHHQQLGREVAGLVLLDSSPPSDQESSIPQYTHIDVLLEWVSSLELLLGHPIHLAREELEKKRPPAQVGMLHQLLIREKVIPARSTPQILMGPLRAFAAALRISYTPRAVFEGNAQIVLADDPRVSKEENITNQLLAFEKWRRWAPSLVANHSSGNHITMLKDEHCNSIVHLIKAT
jgi:thioesterase domain-containing protein